MIAALTHRRTELATLCAQFGVRRLEVFGSAATDEEFDDQTSDVDMIVEFHDDQDLGPWLKHYFSFREALSDLFGYPVDLVLSSAMKNPLFVREANRTRKLLYGPEDAKASCNSNKLNLPTLETEVTALLVDPQVD